MVQLGGAPAGECNEHNVVAGLAAGCWVWLLWFLWVALQESGQDHCLSCWLSPHTFKLVIWVQNFRFPVMDNRPAQVGWAASLLGPQDSQEHLLCVSSCF
jgi:hypothetical protein